MYRANQKKRALVKQQEGFAVSEAKQMRTERDDVSVPPVRDVMKPASEIIMLKMQYGVMRSKGNVLKKKPKLSYLEMIASPTNIISWSMMTKDNTTLARPEQGDEVVLPSHVTSFTGSSSGKGVMASNKAKVPPAFSSCVPEEEAAVFAITGRLNNVRLMTLKTFRKDYPSPHVFFSTFDDIAEFMLVGDPVFMDEPLPTPLKPVSNARAVKTSNSKLVHETEQWKRLGGEYANLSVQGTVPELAEQLMCMYTRTQQSPITLFGPSYPVSDAYNSIPCVRRAALSWRSLIKASKRTLIVPADMKLDTISFFKVDFSGQTPNQFYPSATCRPTTCILINPSKRLGPLSAQPRHPHDFNFGKLSDEID
jgi:hypothetical protein